MPKPKPTVHEVAKQAMDLFHRNADTLVAGFLIRNPDIDPGDIVLVSQATPTGFRFYVDAKELHVPPEAEYGTGILGKVMADDWVNGWNACRQHVIAMAKDQRGGDAEFAPIGGANG